MKSFVQYIKECEGGDVAAASVEEQTPDPYMPPYKKHRKKFGKQLQKFSNVIKEELSDFMKLWKMKGWFYHEFEPVVGSVHSAEDFEQKLLSANFHPDTDISKDSTEVLYSHEEEEIELLRELLLKEPLYGLLGGHGWPERFEKNIRNHRRLSSGCGFKYGDHYPQDFVDGYVTEAISWQILLDEAPVTTLDNRQVIIKSLIYSSEQASGFMKDGDKLLKCVWNASGKCIQKLSEDETRELEISEEDSLKVRL